MFKDYYPVVHHVYGGPASQLVLKRYTVDWHTYLATSLGYVVFQMDARGTSGRGNAWKDAVYKQLGSAEAQDQLAFGAWIKSQSYVKKDQVYVWGWSYGGYLASKILEADANNVYTGGIAVAPVSDWKFYGTRELVDWADFLSLLDSIYTERYMLTPQENPNGYLQSAVSNFTNFYDKRYLLVHGTEDDNVHYQNAAVLVWNLVAAAVPFEMYIRNKLSIFPPFLILNTIPFGWQVCVHRQRSQHQHWPQHDERPLLASDGLCPEPVKRDAQQ